MLVCALLALALLLASCANPRRPPGGPRDETPPVIEFSEPAAEATSVSPRSIRIRFSEYVDPGSFAEAFSITPELPSGRPEFNWSGRTVTVPLPPALRDTTTYIVTIGTALQDVNRVALNAPITLAFATGPQINEGRLSGSVAGAARGRPRPNVNVFAYAAPDSARLDSLPAAPAYRTQTGSDGRFRFTYLREQPYLVVALNDRNGNRRPDPGEPFAVPPRPVIFADTLDRQQRDTLRWIMTEPDVQPPVAQRVRVESQQRISVNFNEAVLLTERSPDGWALTDSVAATTEAVQQAYMRSGTPNRVFLTTTDTMRSRPHWLTVSESVTDSSGRTAAPGTLRFDPSGAPPDTLPLRFVGFLPERAETDGVRVLGPREDIRLRFSAPPPDDSLSFVAVTDTTGNPRSFSAESDNGTVYRLRPDSLGAGEVLSVRVTLPNRPDTTYRQRYGRLSERELGGILGAVQMRPDSFPQKPTTGRAVVEIEPVGETMYAAPRDVTVADGEAFALRGLPAGEYRMRVFWDANGDGTWDGGQLVPYAPPEPIRWLAEPVRVRARWDTELDTLRLE